jgi:hypothetical protein
MHTNILQASSSINVFNPPNLGRWSAVPSNDDTATTLHGTMTLMIDEGNDND